MMKMFLKQKTNKEIVKQQNKKLLSKKKKAAQKEKNANALNAHISFESISNGIIHMKSKRQTYYVRRTGYHRHGYLQSERVRTKCRF